MSDYDPKSGAALTRSLTNKDIDDMHEQLKSIDDFGVLPEIRMRGVWNLYTGSGKLQLVLQENRVYTVSQKDHKKHKLFFDYHPQFHMDYCVPVCDVIERMVKILQAMPDTFTSFTHDNAAKIKNTNTNG